MDESIFRIEVEPGYNTLKQFPRVRVEMLDDLKSGDEHEDAARQLHHADHPESEGFLSFGFTHRMESLSCAERIEEAATTSEPFQGAIGAPTKELMRRLGLCGE